MTHDHPGAPFIIQNRNGDGIRGNVHLPERKEGAPVVVLCHGFKGFKDWGYAPFAAERMAEEGWCTIRFNFSLNGIGGDPGNFTELERFARNSYTQELDDLDTVISAIGDRRIVPDGIDITRLALIGHSRGGGIVILQGSEDERVRAVVSWAGVSSFDRWGEQTKKRWREEGRIEVMNTRTKQRMPMNVSLLTDLEEHRDRLDILGAVRHLGKPLLIVHGEQDVSVPVAEAHEIYAHADKMHTEMEIVPRADHTFGTAHPFAGMTPAFSHVLQHTLFWLRINTRTKR